MGADSGRGIVGCDHTGIRQFLVILPYLLSAS